MKRKGDGYVLNGIKHFIALGGVASLYIVRGRTDRTVSVRKGTSRFLVPKDTPGFSVTAQHDKIGFRAYPNGQLAFEDVYVPKENLLGGKENYDTSGGPLAGWNELELAATAMGIARAAFEAALDYAKQRVQGGKTIIEHQAVAGLLADMYMDLQAGRSLVWQTARIFSQRAKGHKDVYGKRSVYHKSCVEGDHGCADDFRGHGGDEGIAFGEICARHYDIYPPCRRPGTSGQGRQLADAP